MSTKNGFETRSSAITYVWQWFPLLRKHTEVCVFLDIFQQVPTKVTVLPTLKVLTTILLKNGLTALKYLYIPPFCQLIISEVQGCFFLSKVINQTLLYAVAPLKVAVSYSCSKLRKSFPALLHQLWGSTYKGKRQKMRAVPWQITPYHIMEKHHK